MSGILQEEHKNLTLNIEIDGEEKRFVSPKRIKGSLWRDASMVAEEIEGGEILIADLDGHLQFVCDVFNNQFDIGQLEDGIDARDLMKTIYAVTIFVMGQVSVAAEMLTKNIDISSIDIDEKKT